MNNKSLIRYLGVALIACTGCSERLAQPLTNAATQRPKYKIDGEFHDWKTYHTGWTETGLDWSKVAVTPKFDGFDLKQFYYDNDSTYLYLFFKCIPSVKDRYKETHSTGALGCLYIDSDMNTNTGSGMLDASGSSTVPGADIEIQLPVGIHAGFSAAHGSKWGCYVSYEIKRWDPVSKKFSQDVREEDSRSTSPLIAHGKDGVEIALLLSDLRQRKGSRFTFTCWEWAGPREYINTTTIEIN